MREPRTVESPTKTLDQSFTLVHSVRRSNRDLLSLPRLLSTPPLKKYPSLYALRLSFPERRSKPNLLLSTILRPPQPSFPSTRFILRDAKMRTTRGSRRGAEGHGAKRISSFAVGLAPIRERIESQYIIIQGVGQRDSAGSSVT